MEKFNGKLFLLQFIIDLILLLGTSPQLKIRLDTASVHMRITGFAELSTSRRRSKHEYFKQRTALAPLPVYA